MQLAQAVLANISGKESAKHEIAADKLETLTGRFRRNAYRAFSPNELTLAVSALAAGLKPVRKLKGVQVGANDGREGDPVNTLFKRYFDELLLIEPQIGLINRLRETYKDQSGRVVVENMAIGSGEDLVLHMLDPALEPKYRERVGRDPSQIVSSTRTLVVDKVTSRLGLSPEEGEKAVLEVRVASTSVANLAATHGFSQIDLLQVDCEGWDFRVIETLGELRPAIINFEVDALLPGDWDAWKDWARATGYGYIRGPRDALAVLNGDFKSH